MVEHSERIWSEFGRDRVLETASVGALRQAVFEAHVEALLDGHRSERYELRWDGKLNTAYWAFMPDCAGGFHLMVFGDKMRDRCRLIGEHFVAQYARRFYLHELEHSLSSPRRLRPVLQAASAMGVSAALFNLAEDARVDACASNRWGMSLGWAEFEKPLPIRNPYEALAAFVQTEGRTDLLCRNRMVDGRLLERVSIYYRKMARASDSMDVLCIAGGFAREFGAPPATWHVSNEIEKALSLTTAPRSVEELRNRTSTLEEVPEPSSADDASRNLSATGDEFFLSVDEAMPPLSSDVAECREVISNRKVGARIFATTPLPTRHFNRRAFGRVTSDMYRKRVAARDATPPRVHFLLDCSRSMGGGGIMGPAHEGPIQKAKALLTALNDLALDGKIAGRLVLTGGFAGAAQHRVFNFPMDPLLVDRVKAEGEFEGVERALRAICGDIGPNDIVLCYTDGKFNDRAPTKAFWRTKGISPIALYVGGDTSDIMHEWFDTVICRTTVSQLAEAVRGELDKKGRNEP